MEEPYGAWSCVFSALEGSDSVLELRLVNKRLAKIGSIHLVAELRVYATKASYERLVKIVAHSHIAIGVRRLVIFPELLWSHDGESDWQSSDTFSAGTATDPIPEHFQQSMWKHLKAYSGEQREFFLQPAYKIQTLLRHKLKQFTNLEAVVLAPLNADEAS